MLSRRSALTGGGRGLLALALVGAATAACGAGAPDEPDPLQAVLAAARADSELATAAARAAAPNMVPALLVVAAERARHATALVEELARAAGKPTPTSVAGTTSASVQAAPASATRAAVISALRKSADSAAALAPTMSGYRAGLLGSIAAACTASATVALPPGGRLR
jgi:hypothetical protein